MCIRDSHNLHGIKAPAFIPAKAKHMIRDCKLIAEKKSVRFKFNSYFPIRSLNLMRGVIVAEEDNIKNYYIDERRDFEKSTRAACKYLKKLYKYIHDYLFSKYLYLRLYYNKKMPHHYCPIFGC